MEKAYTSSAVLNGVGQAVISDVRELNTALVTFYGTYAGTFLFEGTDSDDKTTWFPIQAARVDANTVVTLHSTANATTAYEFSCHAFKYIRVRQSVFTSGNANVSITATSRAVEPAPVSQMPAGTMPVAVQGIATNATTTTVVNSLASTNASVIKATAGVLYGFCINNASAATRYVRFYRKATAPVPGTDVPVMVVTVPAGSSKEIQLANPGMLMATGIGVAITAGAAVLDATAVAAGDVQLIVTSA